MADLAGAGEPGAVRPQARIPPAPARTGSRGALGGVFLPRERLRRHCLGCDGDAALPGARPVPRDPPSIPDRQRRDGATSGARSQPQVVRLPDRADLHALDRPAFYPRRRIQHLRRDPDSGVLRGAPGAVSVLKPGADRDAALRPGKRALARAGQGSQGSPGPRTAGGQHPHLGLGRAQDQRVPGRQLGDHPESGQGNQRSEPG